MPRFAPHRTLGRLCAVALACALLAACGAPQKPTSYADRAKAEFDKGEKSYEDENFLEAIKAFNVVRTRHPYSKLAALAELRIADAQFELGKHIEAAAAYRSFVRFHPHHPKRAYATYRVGVCYFEQIPGDWWFMPPAYERELGSTKDALRELQSFVETFPKDAKVPDAQEKMKALRHRLAEHELYVARFYWSRNKPRATVMRVDYLLRRYPSVGLDLQALTLKARAHHKLGDNEATTQTFARIQKAFPGRPEVETLRAELSATP